MRIRLMIMLSCALFSMQSLYSTNGISRLTRRRIEEKIRNLEEKKRHQGKRFSPSDEFNLMRFKRSIAKPVASKQAERPQEASPRYLFNENQDN